MTSIPKAFIYPPEFIAKVKAEFPKEEWLHDLLDQNETHKVGHWLVDKGKRGADPGFMIKPEEILESFFDAEGNPCDEPLQALREDALAVMRARELYDEFAQLRLEYGRTL